MICVASGGHDFDPQYYPQIPGTVPMNLGLSVILQMISFFLFLLLMICDAKDELITNVLITKDVQVPWREL